MLKAFVDRRLTPQQRKIEHFINRCWQRLNRILMVDEVLRLNDAIENRLGDKDGPILVGVHNDGLFVLVLMDGRWRGVIYDRVDQTVQTVLPDGDSKVQAALKVYGGSGK